MASSELFNPACFICGAGVDRCRRSALAKLFELRLQVCLEPRAVLAFERAQLFEATLENSSLLVDRAHDLGVLALGVGLQRVSLLLSLAQLGLGAGLRVGQPRVGALAGFGNRSLRLATCVAD